MPKRFSASVAGMHMSCHASANLDIAIPNWAAPIEDRTANNASNRGTNMHELFAKMMELPAKDIANLAHAMEYIAELRSTRRFKVLVEQKVKATWLTTEPETTADLVLHTQDELHIIDLKTGKIPVDAVENTQLMFGAVTYGPLAPKAKGATLHILQGGGFSNWFVDTVRLKQFMDEAVAAEAAIQKGSVTFSPGDHCTFCPANPHGRGAKGKPFCPAMMHIYYPQVVDEDAILALD